ncbi:T9SS type A sorting domain-containing protein, partial [bacterium]|nr:T9SS type A sorting domain-containing protein [bacterium]
SGDISGSFRIQNIQGHYVVQLKSVLQVPVVFTPQTLGIKEATLRAVYRVRASTGFGDSAVVLTTRLTGNTKAARITTNLKGDSLDVRGVLLNATQTASFALANTGDDALYINDIYLQSGANFSIADVNGTDSTQLTVLPNRTIPITISFTPDSNKSYEDNLVIRSNAYNFLNNNKDTLHTFKILGTGSAISFDASTVDPQLNNDLNIDITLQKLNVSDLTGILKYRATGSGNAGYKQRSLMPKSGIAGPNAVLRATIPSDEITEAGLEFFVQISSGATIVQFPDDGEFNPYALSVSVKSAPGLNSSSTLTLPGGTSNKAYRLISFPIILNDKTPQGAFSASNMGELGDKGDWQLYRYDNSQFIKASDGSFGTINSGQSYLCITRKPKILNSGTGKTVTPEEAITQINSGWNMISNPYTFDISWLVIANLNDKIDLTNLVVLDNGRFKYVDQEQALDLKLEPWKGYFYYSDPDSGSFTLYYPALNATAAGKVSPTQKTRLPAKNNLGLKEYIIALELKPESDDDFSTYRLGELQDAQTGMDRFDKQQLPVLSRDEVQLQFVNDQRIHLNSEFKSISQDGNYWDFEIKAASGKQTVELAWTGIETVSANREIVLVDRDRATKIDLKTEQKLIMSVSANEAHHYRLLVGTKQYIESTELLTIPASFYLTQNYPNPFNPTTTIKYGLPQSARVQLIVYNALGQRVRTLVNSEQTAASYNVLWDGRNDYGIGVASGMYFYRLEVRTANAKKTFTQTHKMIFVK